ncbi:hypothetical protein [Paenibacillus sp. FSL M7-0134]|uniref:hypothetical protein n=1 Tax=Paenibacillus sp. FSL M7-0134 TaxID=2954754 RepID=UPI0030FC9DDC
MNNEDFRALTDGLLRRLEALDFYTEGFLKGKYIEAGEKINDIEKIVSRAKDLIRRLEAATQMLTQHIESDETKKILPEEYIVSHIDETVLKMQNSTIEIKRKVAEFNDFLRIQETLPDYKIHNYTIYIYIVSIYEVYLQRVIGKKDNLEKLIKHMPNNIEWNSWKKSANEIRSIRNVIVHNEGVNDKEYIKDKWTIGEEIKLIRRIHMNDLKKNINKFIELFSEQKGYEYDLKYALTRIRSVSE